MQRFFVPAKNIGLEAATISDRDQCHHIRDVLRLKAKDRIHIFDGEGREYLCSIKSISNEGIILMIKERHKIGRKRVKITVACAIPKKAKMDEIIDKLTQLGVDEVIPLKTERTVVKLDKEKVKMRTARWQKVVLAASQQSQRSSLPKVSSLKDFREVVLSSSGFDLKLIPHLGPKRKSLKEALGAGDAKNILVLIGPEGDFSDGEVKKAVNAGFISVSLGENVLRIDTAAIAVVSFIKLYAES